MRSARNNNGGAFTRGVWASFAASILALTMAARAQDEPSHAVEPVFGTSTETTTQEASAPREERPLPIPLSVTTSGGVSLGGYQAGFLYYLTETVKQNRALFEVKMLTGSSAGTINSMMALISLGGAPQEDPRSSLFYSLWTGIHYRDLLDVSDAPPLALSSRKVMSDLSDRIENVWTQGLAADLDIVLGATATRVKGRKVQLSDDFSVPRQEEKFVFRVRGRGMGAAPRVVNYVDQAHGIAQPLLPFDEGGGTDLAIAHRDFAVIRQILFASSAFPLAFPPQRVDFCMSDPGKEGTPTTGPAHCATPTHSELFVDGSMFDRNPLGLAHRTSKAGLAVDADGNVGWAPSPDARSGKLPENLYFIYLDASNSAYPSTEKARDLDNIEALFPTFGAYSQGFVRAAQAKELYTLLDDNPSIRGHVELASRELPSASGLLANFFGFFERRLRVFDFYLGMHDARRYIDTVLLGRITRTAGFTPAIKYPEFAVTASNEESWKGYSCLRAVLDNEGDLEHACDGEELADFRILLQVSLDRLYDHCGRLAPETEVEHAHCLRGKEGKNPPRIIPRSVEWRREADESEFQHTMRLLEEYEFWFEDLGLERERAWLAMSRIREELAGRLDAFAKKLPYGERIVLRTIGKPALNFFKYQPPRAIIYLGAGMGAEVGLSATTRFVPTRWLRFNLALQNQGLLQLLSGAPNVWAVTPLFGMELEIPQLSSPAFQARVGARIGYQLSTGDSFTRTSCDSKSFGNDTAMCTGGLGQALIILSFYERVRIQGGVEWFPDFLPPAKDSAAGRWNGFLHVGWQWISPF